MEPISASRTTQHMTALNYVQHFGLLRKPFSADDIYPVSGLSASLEHIKKGLTNFCRLAVLTGEPGTGKSFLLRQLNESHNTQLTLLNLNPARSDFDVLLTDLLEQLGISAAAQNQADSVIHLQHYLADLAAQSPQHSIVLVIDEAQHLPVTLLQQLLGLLPANLEDDHNTLQFLLAGTPSLEPMLCRAADGLPPRAVYQRLKLLKLDQVADYVQWRLSQAGCSQQTIFPAAALGRIFAHSQGAIRQINTLCDRCLLAAHISHMDTVSVAIVDEVAAATMVHNPVLAADPDQTVLLPDLTTYLAQSIAASEASKSASTETLVCQTDTQPPIDSAPRLAALKRRYALPVYSHWLAAVITTLLIITGAHLWLAVTSESTSPSSTTNPTGLIAATQPIAPAEAHVADAVPLLEPKPEPQPEFKPSPAAQRIVNATRTTATAALRQSEQALQHVQAYLIQVATAIETQNIQKTPAAHPSAPLALGDLDPGWLLNGNFPKTLQLDDLSIQPINELMGADSFLLQLD